MQRASPLFLVLLLIVAACDGTDPASIADTPQTSEDTIPGSPSDDAGTLEPPKTCDELILDNFGVPTGYPFTIGDDDDRKQAAFDALAQLSDSYGVETIHAPSLADYTYTPSWQTTFDLTPVPGDSKAPKLEGLLEDFLDEGADLFAFHSTIPGKDNGSETGAGHFRFSYTQTYCGLTLANASIAEHDRPRGSFESEHQWADRGILVADLRKDGLVHSFEDFLVPALVPAPENPLISDDEAAATIPGQLLDDHACFGPGGHTIKEDELGAVGDPVLLLLEADEGLQLHLAWPVGVFLEGTATAYVDALDATPLAWALHYTCD